MTTRRKRLPRAVQEFIDRQTTVPVAEVCEGDLDKEESPYGSFWYRAIACTLLSGRVKANADGYPNRTDLNRFCKEANFNQHLFERVAGFLVAVEATKADGQGRYGEGPNAGDFWSHDPEKLQTITRLAILRQAINTRHARPFRTPPSLPFSSPSGTVLSLNPIYQTT